MRLTDFDYELPEELIARYPLPNRSDSRLMCVDRSTGIVTHRQFVELPKLLQPHDLFIFNNTKVIPARLFGYKKSGGRIEILIERILDSHRVLAQIRASKPPKIESDLFLTEKIKLKVVARSGNFFELCSEPSQMISEILENYGELPIPPYLNRVPEKSDTERYQTIYAKHPGAIAAPTAGLHFDESLLQQLQSNQMELGFVTLHVGAGTFAPVRVENIKEHAMHAEYFHVSEELVEQVTQAKKKGGRIIAVGSTVARSLESAYQNGALVPKQGETSIFIYPGYQFQCVDILLTNFHLPRSTLLMLVAAFGGYETMISAYCEAIAEKYRFYSYGDAMLIL